MSTAQVVEVSYLSSPNVALAFLIAVLLMALYFIICLIVDRVRKDNKEFEYRLDTVIKVIQERKKEAEEPKFCRCCGIKQRYESKFCHYCGASL